MSTETQSDSDNNESKETKHELVSFLKTVAILIVAAVLIRGSVVEAFKIPSGSMIPTLQIGDHILVSKLSYGLRLPFKKTFLYQYSAPQREDVVVFTRPDDIGTTKDESAINIIKRVIGLPGDIIEIRGTKVYINDDEYNDSEFARWALGGFSGGDFGPVRVPENHIFLMGDNRDHSNDSRFWSSHFLPMERLKGRALFIYWSWDSLRRIGHVID